MVENHVESEWAHLVSFVYCAVRFIPVDDAPQPQCIISVMKVGDGLHSSCCNVFRQAEGAVVGLCEPPLEKFYLSVHIK